ncbi:MAG: response regulator transcription factor [Bacillota bacterium]|nr:response regulator transcription factor [Bacillota bacterium]
MRIVLVEERALVRAALRVLLDGQAEMEVVGEACDLREALALLHRVEADVAALDAELGGRGLEVARRLKASHPRLRIVLLAVSGELEEVREAARAGVEGYLLKTAGVPEFLDCIRTVARGGTCVSREVAARIFTRLSRDEERAPYELTRRELDVLALVALGLTNQEIGRRLYLSESAVKKHLGSAMGKLRVHNRAQAAARAMRESLLAGAGRPVRRSA